MKNLLSWRRFAIAVCVAWAASIALFAYFFLAGQSVAARDGRTAVLLTPDERDFVLTEMRGLLTGVNQTLLALSKSDYVAAHRSAQAYGMSSHANSESNHSIMLKVPLAFKRLGLDTHRKFDSLADTIMAESKSAAPVNYKILRPLADLTANCVACHAAYRFADAK